MNLKNLLSLILVRQIHIDLSVKSTRSHQGLVQNIRPVGGCDYNDIRIRSKTIHLCKKLVQRILPFVVSTRNAVFSTGSTDGIDLIYEDNRRRFGCSLLEKVSYP